MKYPKRSQYKHAKSRYRVRNWAEYEAGLRVAGETLSIRPTETFVTQETLATVDSTVD